MNYRVHYSFDGKGYVDIEAESKEKAEEMFGEGEFSDDVESGENYEVINITTDHKKQ